MNLWRYSVREVRCRPGRALLTLFGVILGIATIVGTRLTVYTARAAYGELSEEMGGQVELEVTAPGQAGFDANFLPELASLPGVQSVTPRVQGVAALVGARRRLPIAVLGTDSVPEGTTTAGRQEAWLDAETAQALELQPGDALNLWTLSGLQQLPLTGLARPQGLPSGPGGLLTVSLASSRKLFALGRQVNSVQIVLGDDADPDQVRDEIARHLPTGLTVKSPGRRWELARATLLATEQGLSALSLMALVAALFVMLNTLLLNLAERRQSFAVLRTLGATQSQLRSLLLREMLGLGLVGTLGGCLLGVVLAWCLLAAMSRYLGVTLPGLRLVAEPFLLAGLLGPGIALLVALVPSWLASRRPPLQELYAQRNAPGRCCVRGLSLAAVLLLSAAVTLALGLAAGWFPTAVGQVLMAPVVVLFLVGSLLFLPLLAGPLWGLAVRLPLGLEGKLAWQQLTRHPVRSHLTAGILFLSLTTAIGFGHLIRGILQDLEHWYHHTIVADFLVRSAMPDTASTLVTAMPEQLADEIQECVPGATVDKLSFVAAEVNGRPVLVLARTFAPDQPLTLDVEEGDPSSILDGLRQGQVVLGTGLARQLGLHAGDTIELATANGPRQLKVAGLAREYIGGGLALYLEWTQAQQHLKAPGVHAFLVKMGDATGAKAHDGALRAFCARHDLFLQSNAELRELIDLLVSRVMGSLWALLALAFLLGALGIINTLTMNVQDQAREFGLLRALGLRCRQVRKVVLWQAGLLGWLSLAPGIPVGVALAWLINRASVCWGGPPVPFQLDGPVILGCGALSLGMALAAALFPARRASCLSVKELL